MIFWPYFFVFCFRSGSRIAEPNSANRNDWRNRNRPTTARRVPEKRKRVEDHHRPDRRPSRLEISTLNRKWVSPCQSSLFYRWNFLWRGGDDSIRTDQARQLEPTANPKQLRPTKPTNELWHRLWQAIGPRVILPGAPDWIPRQSLRPLKDRPSRHHAPPRPATTTTKPSSTCHRSAVHSLTWQSIRSKKNFNV